METHFATQCISPNFHTFYNVKDNQFFSLFSKLCSKQLGCFARVASICFCTKCHSEPCFSSRDWKSIFFFIHTALVTSLWNAFVFLYCCVNEKFYRFPVSAEKTWLTVFTHNAFVFPWHFVQKQMCGEVSFDCCLLFRRPRLPLNSCLLSRWCCTMTITTIKNCTLSDHFHLC